MIVRALTLAGGVAGAAGFSQLPEYSQQYVQRLGGAVDELNLFIEKFDQDADEAGLSREAALVDLAQGGTMGSQRAESMVETIDRHKTLSADLEALKAAGPFTRAAQAARFSDSDIAARAFEDFKPALPLTFEGGIFAGVGMFAGLIAVGLIGWLCALPFRLARRAGREETAPIDA